MVRLTNRITASLKAYFPQVLDWFEDKDTLVFCAFMEQFPSVNAAQTATPEQLTQFFRSHQAGRKSAIARRIQQIQDAGPHLAPRLLVAFGAQRDRFSSAQAFLSYVGIAPVKEESGKKRWVHWRWSCPIFLTQTFVEWGNQSRRFSPWAQAFYQQQKKAGKSHQTAIRALAYKWGRILWRCWQDNIPYDEEKYLSALARKNSPLIKLLGAEDKNFQILKEA